MNGPQQLGNLPALPLDIFFEITRYTAPHELLKLAWTNRTLRDVLLSSKAKNIWKAARERVSPGIPVCPLDMTELEWTKLLFGGPACQCGSGYATRIDIALRRRMCPSCIEEHLVALPNIVGRFEPIKPKVLSLIPYSLDGEQKYYWHMDICNVTNKYDRLRRDIYVHNKPGARERMLRFKKKRREYVSYMTEIALQSFAWSCKDAKRRWLGIPKFKKARYNELSKHLRERGHDERDIVKVGCQVIQSDLLLITRCSADLCKKLEADLIKAKDERIASDRTTLIRQIYNNYKRTVTPMHWIALPRLGAICSIPEFRRLVDCPSNSDFLNPDGLAPLAALLPAFVATETERLRRALLDTLSAQPDFESTSTSSPLQVDPLTLAVSVFKCTSSKTCAGVPLLSWVDVASHICKDGSRHGYFISLKPAVCLGEETLDIDAEEHFEFDQRGFEAVHSILHILGLDPSITTPEDLDNLGPRFVCLECPITGIGRHLKGRHVLSWRQCVSHFIPNARTHYEPSWELVPQVHWETIARSEVNPSYNTPLWGCNHCTVHLEDLQTRAAVLSHVRESHTVAKPNEGQDFFHAVPARRVGSRPVGFVMGPQKASAPQGPNDLITQTPQSGRKWDARIHHCAVCSPHSGRRYSAQGLLRHLKSSHKKELNEHSKYIEEMCLANSTNVAY